MRLVNVKKAGVASLLLSIAGAETATRAFPARRPTHHGAQYAPARQQAQDYNDLTSIGQAFNDLWDSVPKHSPVKIPRKRSLKKAQEASSVQQLPALFTERKKQRHQVVLPMWVKKLAVDTFAAGAAAFAVSPFVTIVDRSIIASSSGTVSMGVCFREAAKELMFKSTTFLRRPEFLWTWGLYSATYFAANAMTTYCDSRNINVAMPKFFSTTLVNLPAGIAKDLAIAKMFGLGTGGAVPLMSYTLFTMRDCGTMAASFSVPPGMSKKMQAAGVEQGSADVMSQLLTPGLGQFIFTPIHLLGLDIYTNRGATLASRIARIGKSYPAAVALRFGRIGAAFGIGGLGNTSIRNRLMAVVTKAEAEKCMATLPPVVTSGVSVDKFVMAPQRA